MLKGWDSYDTVANAKATPMHRVTNPVIAIGLSILTNPIRQ